MLQLSSQWWNLWSPAKLSSQTRFKSVSSRSSLSKIAMIPSALHLHKHRVVNRKSHGQLLLPLPASSNKPDLQVKQWSYPGLRCSRWISLHRHCLLLKRAILQTLTLQLSGKMILDSSRRIQHLLTKSWLPQRTSRLDHPLSASLSSTFRHLIT